LMRIAMDTSCLRPRERPGVRLIDCVIPVGPGLLSVANGVESKGRAAGDFK